MSKKHILILAVLLCLSIVMQLFSKNASNLVKDVSVQFEDNSIVVNIITDFTPDYRYFSLDTSEEGLFKVAIDIKNARFVQSKKITVNKGPLKQIRGNQWYTNPDIVRFVIDLTEKTDYTVEQVKNGLSIKFPFEGSVLPAQVQEKLPLKTDKLKEKKPAANEPPKKEVEEVKEIQGDKPEPVSAGREEKEPVIIIDTPEKPEEAGESAVIAAHKAAEPDTKEIEKPSISDTPLGQTIEMMNYRQISIIDLLRIFSELYHVNIVISKDINEEDLITVRLQNVPLHGALEAILIANEYNYIKKNNIILIKNRATELIGDLQTEIFQLDYINAGDIIDNLRNIKSARGNIEMFVNSPMGEVGVSLPTVSGGNTGGFSSGGAGGAGGAETVGIISEQKDRSDVLIVTDYPEVIEKIRNIIERLDNPPQQVRIEVKLIETKLDDSDKWGINWSATVEAIGRGGMPSGARQTGGGATGGAAGATIGKEAETGASVGTQVAGKPITVNNFRFGTLSFTQLRGLLEMLEQKGNSRLLNQPSISVIDNQQADIAVGTLVPVEVYQPIMSGGGGGGGQQQQGTAGGTTIQQQFVSISLTVIPHVSINKYITLWIQPAVSEITGYTGKYGDLPITSTRTANSQVRVRDGDTVIIGGLIKEDKLQTTKRVKFLHKIPLFGSLFVYNAIESKRSELAIFITPYIIRSEDFVADKTFSIGEK